METFRATFGGFGQLFTPTSGHTGEGAAIIVVVGRLHERASHMHGWLRPENKIFGHQALDAVS